MSQHFGHVRVRVKVKVRVRVRELEEAAIFLLLPNTTWLTCKLLKREQISVSSSSTLRQTSPIMALSRTMASRAEVCSSFTTYAWREEEPASLTDHGSKSASEPQPRLKQRATARRSVCGGQRIFPSPRVTSDRQESHQDSLVQHLTALHVGRLYVDAVGPALPEGTNHSYCCRPAQQVVFRRGTGGGLHRKIHLHLHVPETLDAKKRLILRGEQDVGLLVESCGDRRVRSPGVHSGEAQVRLKVWREDLKYSFTERVQQKPR